MVGQKPAHNPSDLAMKAVRKNDLPVEEIRRFLEPSPIVLVSSTYRDETNIMTMGWHMVMGFDPSLIGCYIWDQNHSFEMIRKSRECVINIPTLDLATRVVGIGNSSGRDVEKFKRFELTAKQGEKVKAPLIEECFANFECKVTDLRLIAKYSLFVLEVVKVHVAVRPKYPKTIHYRGDGEFMISGENTGKFRKLFKKQNLCDELRTPQSDGGALIAANGTSISQTTPDGSNDRRTAPLS
jgi:flavin reductase (DIM6/NTAB) family NADH-FMN oxidoreductase RutF